MIYNNRIIFMDAFGVPHILVKGGGGNDVFKPLPPLSYEDCHHASMEEISRERSIILNRCTYGCDELIVGILNSDGLSHFYSAKEIDEDE